MCRRDIKKIETVFDAKFFTRESLIAELLFLKRQPEGLFKTYYQEVE